jgi:aquaporin Z
LRRHWPEYLIEAGGLGLFMVSAGLFATLLWYPASPLAQAVPDGVARRALMGLLMGLTAILIIYSPWGRQSGAHINPAVTLTFWRLGKVRTWDAVFYVLAQFIGGALGVLLVLALLGAAFALPPVSYVATVPGPGGDLIALLAEAAISCVLMLVILLTTNTPRLMRLTGVFAGCLVALYITLEAPLSGMSMNPARTLASALPGSLWQGLWLYFVAPPPACCSRSRSTGCCAARPRWPAPSSTITRSAAASSAATTWPRAATAIERSHTCRPNATT